MYLPYVEGHAEIYIGDHVTITGRLTIISGRFNQRPVLTVKDRVSLGNNCVLSVNQEITIEEDVMISNDCRIFDSDGHPRDAQLRIKHAPLSPRDIRPVRICRYAWIGNGVQILKGVTIGEGAIIGANSVVISSIPEYCVAMGNPAEIYFRNVGKPKRILAPLQAD
jgi:acetyltransferase-like isoleucine patch superfamily enzyme